MNETKTPIPNEHAAWLRNRAASPYFALARLGLLDTANAIERLETSLASAIAAKERAEALRELVRLKALHDKLDSLKSPFAVGWHGWQNDEEDYIRNKPLAWSAARALLAELNELPQRKEANERRRHEAR